MKLKIRRPRSQFLDVEVRVSSEVHARVLDRPGRWMSPEELSRIVEHMREVARSTLDGLSLDYGVLTGSSERLDHAILTVLYESETGRPIAFSALSLMPLTVRGVEEDVFHMGLVMIDSDFRSQRLAWVVYGLSVALIFFQRQLRPFWVSSVTQVPAVFGMMCESFDEVFPSGSPADRRGHSHLVIARQMMERHRHVFGVGEEADFDPARFVITNAYTGGSDNLKKSFDEAAKHRDDSYNNVCRDTLDYERGDDFLQVGQFNLSTARRYLMRSVPRRSLARLLFRGLFLLGGSILLPVLHWFTPSTQLGDLRPWKE